MKIVNKIIAYFLVMCILAGFLPSSAVLMEFQQEAEAVGDETSTEIPDSIHEETLYGRGNDEAEREIFDLRENTISAVSRQNGSGIVDVSVSYVIDDSYGIPADTYLELSIPNHAVPDLASVEQNGIPNTVDYSEKTHIVHIPLFAVSGEIIFSFTVEKTGPVWVGGTLYAVVDGLEYTAVLADVSIQVDLFHADCFYDNNQEVSINGFAPAGAEINIYVDQQLVKIIDVPSDGYYSDIVSVDGWEIGSVKTFRLTCSGPDKLYVHTENYYRKAAQPELISMKYYDHAGAEEFVDFFSALQNNTPVPIAYVNNDDPFVFVVQYSHPELIGKVFISAEKNGAYYSIDAEFDENTQLFTAEGYFVSNNKHFSPNRIDIAYIPRGTDRVVKQGVAISENSTVYSVISNSYQGTTVTPEEHNTEEHQTYNVSFEENSGLEDVSIQCSVEILDVDEGMALYTSQASSGNYICSVVPGEIMDYFISLDLTDPEGVNLLIVGPINAENRAVKYFLSCKNPVDDDYLKWLEVSQTLERIYSVAGIVGDICEIYTDTTNLKEEINNASNLNEEQKVNALKEVDALSGDRAAFILLSTMVPMLVASGGMAAPVVAAEVLMSAMGIISDRLFELRAINIKTGGADVNWSLLDGSTEVTGTDGILYRCSYSVEDTSYRKGLTLYKKAAVHVRDVQIVGNGTTYRTIGSIANDAVNAVKNELPSEYSVYSSLEDEFEMSISEGITGISLGLACSSISALYLPSTLETVPFRFYESTKLLTIADKNGGYGTIRYAWTEIPDDAFLGSHLKKVTISEDVTHIGERAFSGCQDLSEVVLKEGLTSIGESAFDWCPSLTTVTIPSTVVATEGRSNGVFSRSGLERASVSEGMTVLPTYLFNNAENLVSVHLPNSLREISEFSFEGCTKLTYVNLPYQLSKIERSAFKNCSSLRKITLPASLVNCGSDIFEGSGLYRAIIEEGMNKIPAGLFSCAEYLQLVEIPDSVTIIGSQAFTMCRALKEINFPTNLMYIHFGAFLYCESLENIDFPENLVEIEDAAFEHCTSLKEVFIPASLNYSNHTDSQGGFFAYSGLESAVLEEGTTSINKGLFKDAQNLTTITIPDTVKTIGPSAFDNCDGLTELQIPDGVTSLGYYVFRDCDNLEKVVIPGSVVSIGEASFGGCEKLETAGPIGGDYNIEFGWTASIPEYAFTATKITDITLPDNIKEIGSYAFAECQNLENIMLPGSIDTMGSNVFYHSSNLKTAGLAGTGCDIEFEWTDAIPDYAFDGSELTQITFPVTLKEIGSWAFCACRLKAVEIPETVTVIGEKAFWGDSISNAVILSREAVIGADNFLVSSYNAGNNVIFGYEGSTAEKYAERYHIPFIAIDSSVPSPDFVAPTALSVIEPEAFRNCAFTCVRLSDNITDIEDFAFAYSSNLKHIYIYNSTEYIAENAFQDVRGLTIHGTEGSYVQEYASENGFHFVAE